MAALGELAVYIIYLLLAIGGLVFLFFTFRVKRSIKPFTLLGFGLFVFLIAKYSSHNKEVYRDWQLQHVGIYYLTDHPDCDSCVLELKEDMTYEVRSGNKVIEKSNWHFESGGDYWITYLDHDRHQLGAGDYAYKKYKLKYPDRRD